MTFSIAAQDLAGNATTVTTTTDGSRVVVDTIAPVLNYPAGVAIEATGPNGALVNYDASATDTGGVATFTTYPASGLDFPLGSNMVNVRATDQAGNYTGGSFFVTVSDTTPPVLTLPMNMTVEATGPGGAIVGFQVSATDAVDGAVSAVATPASGSLFPIGTTTVSVSATDHHQNSASGSFTVTVHDRPLRS